jgi:hypothetical protein
MASDTIDLDRINIMHGEGIEPPSTVRAGIGVAVLVRQRSAKCVRMARNDAPFPGLGGANRNRYGNALSLRRVGGFSWQPRD